MLRFRKPQPRPEIEIDGEEAFAAAPKNIGGRRRRRQAAGVIGIALLSAAAGIGIGTKLKSPADRAAERQAPTASRITVPIEKRSLAASITLSGSVDFKEPVLIRLAGPVGASAGSTQVITRPPIADSVVAEGDVVAEISGRPVFVLQGDLPVFRSLEPGVTGPDVAQLEQALVRLGFDPGPIDEIYDDRTEAAIDGLYQAAGYESEGPSDEQRKALRDAQKSTVAAEQGVATAKDALAKGGSTVSASEKLRLQQGQQDATDAIPAAESAAKRDNDAAAAKVTTDTGLRDAAKIQRDAARTILTNASAPDAIDPSTEAPFTSTALAELQSALAEKESALLVAEQALTDSINAQATTKAAGDKAVGDAKDALALAKVQLSDALQPADTTSLRDAVTAAQAVLDQARTDQAAVEADSGTKLPAGEITFAPILPSTITGVSEQAVPGAPVPTDTLFTLSSTDTRITARVSRADAALVQSDTAVTITVRDAGIETTGTIASIGAPASDGSSNDGSTSGDSDNGSSSGSSGRLQVIVVPDDPSVLRDWVGATARVTIAVSSTAGEVLAVPVAAIFVGPDGESQVEVERQAALADDPGSTEIVKVKVGLAAQGFAEITSLGGPLAAGDRVVVGAADTTGDDTTGDDTNPGDTVPDDAAGG